VDRIVDGNGPELAPRFYLEEMIPWPRGDPVELGQTDARVAALASFLVLRGALFK
jgi:hypothetical protein